jgi:flagellar hook assembly protein FlgD
MRKATRRRRTSLLAAAGAALLCCLSLAAGAATLMPAANDTVDDVFAFPVPWAPNSGSALNGTAQGGVTFTNLPVEGTVTIYTVSGKLVRTLTIAPGTLLLRWDGRNTDGAEVVSGIYFWRIQSGRNGKSGKLVVIR